MGFFEFYMIFVILDDFLTMLRNFDLGTFSHFMWFLWFWITFSRFQALWGNFDFRNFPNCYDFLIVKSSLTILGSYDFRIFLILRDFGDIWAAIGYRFGYIWTPGEQGSWAGGTGATPPPCSWAGGFHGLPYVSVCFFNILAFIQSRCQRVTTWIQLGRKFGWNGGN